MDTSENKQRWKPGKRDAIFLALVATVVLTLVFTSSKKTTKPTPDDMVHRTATSRAQCMHCHGPNGVDPQPKGHIKGGQCFLCQLQPKDWKGPVK